MTHDGSCDDFTLTLREVFHERVAFVFTELLNHHLLGGLRRDAAKLFDRDFFAAGDFAFIISDIAPDRELAREAIHFAAKFIGVERVEVFTRSADHRHLKVTNEMLTIDIAIACDGVEDAESF